jgi:hypothetical protein
MQITAISTISILEDSCSFLKEGGKVSVNELDNEVIVIFNEKNIKLIEDKATKFINDVYDIMENHEIVYSDGLRAVAFMQIEN